MTKEELKRMRNVIKNSWIYFVDTLDLESLLDIMEKCTCLGKGHWDGCPLYVKEEKVCTCTSIPHKRGIEFYLFQKKITDHVFDGSCCYNNNENGKGHAECRYPYNPGRANPANPSSPQCLRLKEEHILTKSSLPPLPGKPQWGNKMTEQAIKELQDIVSQFRDYLEALSKNI